MSFSYFIRDLQIADLERVYSLIEATGGAWSRLAIAEEIQRPSGINLGVFLSGAEEKLIALLFSYRVTEVIELSNLVVDLRCRRKGIAMALFSQLEKRAVIYGVRELLLEVSALNLSAKKLYLSRGFNEVAVRKNYYRQISGPEDAILMRKLLSSTETEFSESLLS